MARKSNQQSLGEVIREMLSSYRLEGKLKQARVLEAWPEVVGEMITKYTRDIYFKRTRLYVKIDSPVIKNELSYSKSEIIASLNNIVEEEIVTDLIFV
ncbi:MAG: DUF721 domain-containing protein [Bacteroidales bacterium]|jgi:hypothetical protein|nr:DUF721 domain-containing protein [Bacteroidales bacterium]